MFFYVLYLHLPCQEKTIIFTFTLWGGGTDGNLRLSFVFFLLWVDLEGPGLVEPETGALL